MELVKDDYFTDVAFFRCVKNFLVQFGILPDASSPKKAYWRAKGKILDDPTLGIPFKRWEELFMHRTDQIDASTDQMNASDRSDRCIEQIRYIIGTYQKDASTDQINPI